MKNELISFFQKETNQKLAAAKKAIRKQIEIYEYDNSIKIKGVRFFYSFNPNYAEGGAGWYITNQSTRGGKVFKVSNNY